MAVDIWSYREAPPVSDVVGYTVEASDGEIGKVHEATSEAGDSSIVIGSGPWNMGKKVVLPAGTVERVDQAEEKIYVDRTMDEIKDAPEYDASGYAEQEYRVALASYYSRFYA